MQKVIWIDTETTGLDANIHGLREVGYIIEIDGEVKEEGLLYINTKTYNIQKYLSNYVRDVMGVTEEKLLEYEDSQSQNLKFIKTIKGYLDLEDKYDKFMVAGFNVEFDIEFIKVWFKDSRNDCSYNDYFGHQTVDILSFVRNLKYFRLFETKNNKLETLCNHFDIDIKAHEALSDIQATKKLHEKLRSLFISQQSHQ
ncbi:MAG: exonuclease domain-containing protein [Sulfurimonas sp.]|nr:exonuclease domain-containing protein [Sulfurimonas sp.]